MPYAQFRDLNLFYEDLGVGEPILFLHSHFSRGILAFSGQMLPFQKQYRCLFPDFRGHGRTRCGDLTWDSRRIAQDMADFLDTLGIPSAHLFGYSCGAGVAFYLASSHPEKVRSVITVGGGAYPRPEGADSFLPEALQKAGKTRFIQEMAARHADAHRGDWKTYLEQTVADWKVHPSLTGEEWKAVTCPVFCINGEHDPFGTSAELKAKMPHAKTYEVKGGDHRPHFVTEQAKELNAMILDFLAGLERE